jgi:hypothetical protein
MVVKDGRIQWLNTLVASEEKDPGNRAFTIIYFALLITSPPISLVHTGDLI